MTRHTRTALAALAIGTALSALPALAQTEIRVHYAIPTIWAGAWAAPCWSI